MTHRVRRVAAGVAAPATGALEFAIWGPIGRDDLPGLTARVCALLQRSEASVAWCDVRGVAPDAVTVDALARLQLGARRHGCVVRLRGASRELRELVDLMGLSDVLAERTVMKPQGTGVASVKIRARVSMSADGYVTTPSGWPALTADPAFVSGRSHGFPEFLESCEAALMGRRTFEPALSNDRWPWPKLDVFVLASRRPRGTPDQVVTDSDPQRLLERLRAVNRGGDVHLVGGPTTIETFRALGALDTLELVVLPLLLGDGMRLTPSLSLDAVLAFERERALGGGSVAITYAVGAGEETIPALDRDWSPASQGPRAG